MPSFFYFLQGSQNQGSCFACHFHHSQNSVIFRLKINSERETGNVNMYNVLNRNWIHYYCIGVNRERGGSGRGKAKFVRSSSSEYVYLLVYTNFFLLSLVTFVSLISGYFATNFDRCICATAPLFHLYIFN